MDEKKLNTVSEDKAPEEEKAITVLTDTDIEDAAGGMRPLIRTPKPGEDDSSVSGDAVTVFQKIHNLI